MARYEGLSITEILRGHDVVDILKAGAPSDGTSGTGAGKCGPGSECRDYTNGVAYINTNTKASPTWVKIGTQS